MTPFPPSSLRGLAHDGNPSAPTLLRAKSPGASATPGAWR